MDGYAEHHLETLVIIGGFNDPSKCAEETEAVWDIIIQKSKSKFTPTRFILLYTIKSLIQKLQRVDALNQSLQKELRKEKNIISIDFNEICFPKKLANNIFLDAIEYIFLLFAGTKLVTIVLQGHIENNHASATMRRT